MKTRIVGKSGLPVSAIGYGCMGLTGVYGRGADRQEAIRILHAAVERGVTLFDASVDMTDADLRDINDAASRIIIQGARLPEDVLKLTNR